jgi:hypothetical protein
MQRPGQVATRCPRAEALAAAISEHKRNMSGSSNRSVRRLPVPIRPANDPPHVLPLRQLSARGSRRAHVRLGEFRCRTWRRPGTSSYRPRMRQMFAVTRRPASATSIC